MDTRLWLKAAGLLAMVLIVAPSLSTAQSQSSCIPQNIVGNVSLKSLKPDERRKFELTRDAKLVCILGSIVPVLNGDKYTINDVNLSVPLFCRGSSQSPTKNLQGAGTINCPRAGAPPDASNKIVKQLPAPDRATPTIVSPSQGSSQFAGAVAIHWNNAGNLGQYKVFVCRGNRVIDFSENRIGGIGTFIAQIPEAGKYQAWIITATSLGEDRSKWCGIDQQDGNADFTVISSERKGELEAASERFERVARYFNEKLYDAAINQLNGMDSAKNDPLISHWFGLLYYQIKQYNQAKQHYLEAVTRAGRRGDVLSQALAARALSRLYYQLGESSEGNNCLDRVHDFYAELGWNQDGAARQTLENCRKSEGRQCPVDWLLP